MAKFTGFLVQALLVVLSFCLNVSHNTNALRDGVPGILPATATTAAQENTTPTTEKSNYDYRSNHEAGRALNSGAPSDNGSAQHNGDASNSIRDDVVTNSTNEVDLAREEGSEIDERVSPKGGKLVSIPSVEVDALRGSRGADDRVIGVSKAELFGLATSTSL